jgi:hypothetical protein
MMRAMRGALPPCGLYRTVTPVASVEAGRLVYFHNHGDPGPGVYLPQRWQHNRAQFAANGITIGDDFDPGALRALPAEGFYRVVSAFYCCAKQCTRFEPDMFLQLGYNGAGRGILFVPELGPTGFQLPERGSLVDDPVFGRLAPLKVPMRAPTDQDLSLPRGLIVH